MTIVGSGGCSITGVRPSNRYIKDYKRLDPRLREAVDSKIDDLLANPRPPGIRFEKLKGYSSPDIYSIHVNGNYKITFAITGSIAFLRRVACHNDIDRAP